MQPERQDENTSAWGARGEEVMDAAESWPHPAPPTSPAAAAKCAPVIRASQNGLTTAMMATLIYKTVIL